MTREDLDALGIAGLCGEPDPLTCYAQSDEEPCRSCPIVSWLSAMVFSGTWTDETTRLEDLAISGR
jgi:hypothetical protein